MNPGPREKEESEIQIKKSKNGDLQLLTQKWILPTVPQAIT